MAITVTGYHRARDIEGELARLGSGRDPSPVFLVPSTGDRELLRDIILEKVSFGPSEPPILRWEDLYREAAREMDVPRGARRRQIDPPDHWLIVRHVLERLKARVEEAAIPAGARHSGFIWTLGEDLRELLREEVRPDILALSMGCDQRCLGADCPKLPDPGALLCRLYRDYLEYLDDHSLADSAQTATVIARTLEEDPPRAAAWVGGRDFVFAGFMSFTRSQLSLIGVLSRLGARVRVFMPESGLQYHDARAQLLGDDPAALPIKAFDPIPFLTVVAGNPRLELETLARNLALWRAGKGELQARLGIPFPGWGEIGLSLDAPRLGLAVEVLSRYRIPHTLRGGPSVSETALWKTASSVIEAAALGFPRRRRPTSWLNPGSPPTVSTSGTPSAWDPVERRGGGITSGTGGTGKPYRFSTGWRPSFRSWKRAPALQPSSVPWGTSPVMPPGSTSPASSSITPPSMSPRGA